jgi:murein L,D-transpeptidase YcbB/YkuD
MTLILFAETTDNNESQKQVGEIPSLAKTFQTNSSELLKNIPQKKFFKKFYRNNNYEPLWIENKNLNKKKYTLLFSKISDDLTLDKNGLIFQQYQNLNKFIESNLTKDKIFRAEIKLTSLYYNFLKHTIYGEIEWKKFSHKLASLKKSKIDAAWIRTKPKYNLSKLLLKNDINQTIVDITPKKYGYAALIKALAQLKELKEKGEWEKLPSFKKLSIGSTGDIVQQLRVRLKQSADYVDCKDENLTKIIVKEENNETVESNSTKVTVHLSKDAIFGECLNTAVKHFQTTHGLVVDGIVGKGTQKALNMSIEEKIRKVLLNIDRIKWLPRDENQRYIVVNIPEFMLHYIENNETKQELRVIVGDKRHPTPIFSEKISFIVLNPYWKVPEGIVRREVIPAMIKNPNYLRKNGLQVRQTWSEKSRLVDVSSLYWEDYRYGNQRFPYRIMQPPGKRNALGKIKFKFPNRFSVYLHDTPTRHLFKKTVRAFSHGCVRLSQPEVLLETIATFNKNIDMEKATRTLRGKRKRQLNMGEKLRIYLVYLTAGVNEKGEIEFRNDIYGYDKYTKRRTN